MPTFEEGQGSFTIKFKRELAPENVLENVPENRTQKILAIILKNKKITIPELAKELKINEKTIKKDIQKFKEENNLPKNKSEN